MNRKLKKVRRFDQLDIGHYQHVWNLTSFDLKASKFEFKN